MSKTSSAARRASHLLAVVAILAGILIAAPTAASPPAPPSVAAFAKLPQVLQPRLSPTGEYVAAIFRANDQSALGLFRTADMKLVNSLRLAFDESVVDYWWSGPLQVIATLGNNEGDYGEPVVTGELMLVDITDPKPRYLLGYRSGVPLAGTMVDPTPDDPDTAMVKLRRLDAPHDQPWVIFRIGTSARVGFQSYTSLGPEPASGSAIVTDSKGALRYAAVGDLALVDDDASPVLLRRDGEKWALVPRQGKIGLVPRFVGRDDRWVYHSATGLTGAPDEGICLARQPLDGSGPVQQLACRAGSDVDTVVTTADGRDVLAVVYQPDLPVMEFTVAGATHPDAKILVGLREAFPGNLTVPVNASRDGNRWLVHVVSDRNPGQYVLFDRRTEVVGKLFDVSPELPEAAMRPVQAVRYAARDGMALHGYLTLPRPAADSARPPLVVVPHGGPIGVRDEWSFDAESQLLASRGYAVLRVNFRGSDGYGRRFLRAGRKQWATGMIDDLTDGVRHVIGKGLVDGRRVAIAGGSYGGYAALMSAVREPALYRAVVASAAPVDLERLVADGAAAESRSVRNFLDAFLGSGKAELAQASLLPRLDALKAPVLIVHGKGDRRVPYAQAKKLRAALEKRDIPYEWLVKSDEGHGFVRHAARTEYYEKMLAFLEKHLK